MAAPASPLPSEDTTPPVTKMNLVVTSRLLSRCEPFFHEFPLLGHRARRAVEPPPPQHGERPAHLRAARHPEGEEVAAPEPRVHPAPLRQIPLDPPSGAQRPTEPGRERG